MRASGAWSSPSCNSSFTNEIINSDAGDSVRRARWIKLYVRDPVPGNVTASALSLPSRSSAATASRVQNSTLLLSRQAGRGQLHVQPGLPRTGGRLPAAAPAGFRGSLCHHLAARCPAHPAWSPAHDGQHTHVRRRLPVRRQCRDDMGTELRRHETRRSESFPYRLFWGSMPASHDA